jgi:MoaA/NifB/PqqE/SkfB family radical SAM enzyme
MAIDSLKLIRNMDNFKTKRPVTADIFLTNFCNNKCPYCTYHRWSLDPGARYMTFGEFVRYAERLISFGVKGIILTGGGEPTINPDFDKITKWLEDKGIRYGINTNFNVFKDFNPTYLKVSLDGYDECSYKCKRGVHAYSRVIENIKKYRENDAHRDTSFGVQIVVSELQEIERFYDGVKGLDVDYIVYRPIESTNRCAYTDSDIQTTVPIFMKHIQALSRQDKRVVMNAKWTQLDVFPTVCSANWAQITLDERGNVIYCCHKPYEVVGHIMDDDILEKKARFRTDISKCDVPCRLTSSNLLQEYMQKPMKDDCFV